MNELPANILREIKRIEQEKYVNGYSKETFDKIFIPWLLNDEEVEKSLSKISSYYVITKFMLNYLENITSDLQKQFNIPLLTSKDLANKEDIDKIEIKLVDIQNEPAMIWFKEECSPILDEILDGKKVTNLENLTELSLIEDILIEALEQGKENSISGYYFEILYQFKERLEEANLLEKRPKQTLIIENLNIVKDLNIIKNFNILFDDSDQGEDSIEIEYNIQE